MTRHPGRRELAVFATGYVTYFGVRAVTETQATGLAAAGEIGVGHPAKLDRREAEELPASLTPILAFHVAELGVQAPPPPGARAAAPQADRARPRGSEDDVGPLGPLRPAPIGGGASGGGEVFDRDVGVVDGVVEPVLDGTQVGAGGRHLLDGGVDQADGRVRTAGGGEGRGGGVELSGRGGGTAQAGTGAIASRAARLSAALIRRPPRVERY